MKLRSLFAVGVVACSLALAEPALAETQYVSATSGPVWVPNTSVMACAGATCQATPPLSTVGLRVGLLAEFSSPPPTITQGACSWGLGTALVVNSGATGAIVVPMLFGTRPDGSPYEQPVAPPFVLGPNAVVSVQACWSPMQSLALSTLGLSFT